MDAEQIVRTLAAMRPNAFQCYGDCGCVFCFEFVGGDEPGHTSDCLYQQAREWVAANP